MNERYGWVLSPSKFEASRGCPCFEEDPRSGAEYKDAGTNLHEFMADPGKDRSVLTVDDREALAFCDGYVDKLIAVHGPPVFDTREHRFAKTDRHPRGSADRILVFNQGLAYVIDWKFGQMGVPSARENPQVRAYLLMALCGVEDGSLLIPPPAVGPIASYTGVIVQPALDLEDEAEFTVDEVKAFESELKEANDRVADPFKQPDPSDGTKCARCRFLNRCPAVSTAITEFVAKANLLPMPEQFAPHALVSERDRLIAQELASIFIAWGEAVKSANKDYAITHGGTLGGVYNVSTRANGFSVKDGAGLARELVGRGLLSAPEELLDFVRVTKTGVTDVVEMHEPGRGKEVAAELVEKYGEPNPPVAVFRKGGKKQIASAVEALGLPVIENPFKNMLPERGEG